MQALLNPTIPRKLEKLCSYLLLSDEGMFAATVDLKNKSASPVNYAETTGAIENYCAHDVRLIIDPRKTKSLWQKAARRKKHAYEQQYTSNRAVYSAEVDSESGYSIISTCTQAVMHENLNNKQLFFAEITRCCDGAVGLTTLPAYFNRNLQSQVFILIFLLEEYFSQILPAPAFTFA